RHPGRVGGGQRRVRCGVADRHRLPDPDHAVAGHHRPAAGAAEGDAVVLRQQPRRDRAALRHLQGRHPRAVLPGAPEGPEAGRQGADPAVRLRWLRDLADPVVLRRPRPRVAVARWRLRGRQHPRRRRVRPALAPGCAQGQPPPGVRGHGRGGAGPGQAQDHLAAAPGRAGRQQRRPADRQHADPVPGTVRRGGRAGPAAGHEALQQAAGRRLVDGRVRQSGHGRLGVHQDLLAVPPVRSGEGIPTGDLPHLHPRRPRPPGPCAQDGGEDDRRGQGRDLLREHRGRARRRGQQRPGRAHERPGLCLPLAAAEPAGQGEEVGSPPRPRPVRGRSASGARPQRYRPVTRTGTASMRMTLLLALSVLMTINPAAATPPDAERKPFTVTTPFGAQRQDDYYWLRDDSRQEPAMLAYLEAENAYADQLLAPLKPLQDKLYGEIVARIKQDDSSVPYREHGWWYYARYE